MLLVGWQEGHLACKTEWWGAGVVICLERGADLHMAQLMPLPLTDSCFSKIQIGFTFLVSAHPGSPGQRAVKWVCVCVWDGAAQRMGSSSVMLSSVCVCACILAFWRRHFPTSLFSLPWQSRKYMYVAIICGLFHSFLP